MQAMHVTDLAINRAMGMRLAPPGSDHILELPESPSGGAPGSESLLINHLGTVHASVQFALAEAASGEFLLRQLGVGGGGGGPHEQVFAVLRTATVKFRKPAPPGFGKLRASARFADTPGTAPTDAAQLSAALASRGRALVAILVEVADARGVVTMTGQFDWFLQQHRDEA
jgi:acyl-coenzyme A thioesterase PaaI-like protein